jgi:hypothetical protein
MDLTKDRKKLIELYRPGTEEFTLVDVPALPFAIIDGQGSPDHGAGADAIKNLFTAIYPIRREARKKMGKAFVEPPVEMLYWADDMRDLGSGNKENWKWRAMITLPVWVDEEIFSNAVTQAKSHMDAAPNTLRMEYSVRGNAPRLCMSGRRKISPPC